MPLYKPLVAVELHLVGCSHFDDVLPRPDPSWTFVVLQLSVFRIVLVNSPKVYLL